MISQISNWSSVGYLKCVQFYSWFRLHQTLDQLQTILGEATHYVSTVTEQSEQYTKGKQNWKPLNETVYDATKQNSDYSTREK